MNDTWPQEPAMPLSDDEPPDGWDGPDAEPLPPTRLPALAEVATAARGSHLLERVPWVSGVGWERLLTSTEVLKRADARASIADLDLLPPADPRRRRLVGARDVLLAVMCRAAPARGSADPPWRGRRTSHQKDPRECTQLSIRVCVQFS
jgi:hypothetical protein